MIGIIGAMDAEVQLLTEQINLPSLEAIAGVNLNDLQIGQTILDILDQLRHLGTLLVRLIRQRSKLFEGSLYPGLCFLGIRPLSFLADIIPVALG